jgi:hypothetical protein
MAEGNRSGGGITSRNNVSPPYRTGSPARVQNVKGVSQIGQAMGNHATGSPRVMQGVAVTTMGPAMSGARLGNEVAASTVCGPGGSRSVMATGSQQQHGMAEGRAAPQGRDILSDFGPERGGR